MSAPPSSESVRLSFLYGVLFTVIGVQMPFWPVWLESRGMGPMEIGILLGAIYWAKVITNPVIAQIVDHHGGRRRMMIGLAAAALLFFIGYVWAEGFWPLLILGVLSGSLAAAQMPLTETVTMTLTRQGRLDYGRVRLWGSLTFIGASILAGTLVESLGPPIILTLIIVGAAATVAGTLVVPEPRRGPTTGSRLPFTALLRDRRYRLFLVTASLTQASHCVYYGFATLHWRAQGLSSGVIGGLWAIGVVAEIALFLFSGAAVRRVGAPGLLLIGAVGGVLRWSLLAVVAAPWLLVPLQVLHAATFGATHLGAMHLIADTIDPRLAARAQALYSSVAMGLVPGIALLVAGPLYDRLHGHAFAVAALIALAASIFGTRLVLRLRHEKAAESSSAA